MQEQDYEYRGMIAEFWDLLRGDTSNWSDRFFFKEVVAKSGEPVLDVGCGTGRLLLDFLADGVDIDGVDNSPEMLALCRAKAEQMGLSPTLYHQSMEALDLPRAYQTIIVPSSSFQLVIDPEDAAKAMDSFFAHLAPGGTLAMPFMRIRTGESNEDVVAEEWSARPDRVRPEDGAIIRRWMRSTYDIPAQLEHTEDRYEVLVNDEIVASEYHSRSPATRWYTQEQAVDLYRRSGFADIRLFSDFTWEPAAPSDPVFCILGTRPPA